MLYLLTFHRQNYWSSRMIYPFCFFSQISYLYYCYVQISLHQKLKCTPLYQQLFYLQDQLSDCSLQRQSGPCFFCAFCPYYKQRYVYLVDAVGSSRILIGKQKIGLTFNSDKLGGNDFTKCSKLTMCSAQEEAQAIVPASTGQHRHCTWSILKIL